jgi:hypothetical protein
MRRPSPAGGATIAKGTSIAVVPTTHPSGGRVNPRHLRVCSLLGAVLLAATASASAQDKVCLLEGDFLIGGQQVLISDCAENRTMPKDEFRAACAGMAQFTLAGETYQASVSFGSACPPAPQGTCEGIFGGAMNASYYKRDAKTLEDTRKSCLAMQGQWK